MFIIIKKTTKLVVDNISIPLNFNNLIAFKITINAAPVSLKTAIQSVSTPGKIKTNATDFNDNRKPNILFNNR